MHHILHTAWHAETDLPEREENPDIYLNFCMGQMPVNMPDISEKRYNRLILKQTAFKKHLE